MYLIISRKRRKKNTPIDFIQFCKDWLAATEVKGKRNYQTALNAFIAFLGKDKLNTQPSYQVVNDGVHGIPSQEKG